MITNSLNTVGTTQVEELREGPGIQQDVPEGRAGRQPRRRAARCRRPERRRAERRVHSEARANMLTKCRPDCRLVDDRK